MNRLTSNIEVASNKRLIIVGVASLLVLLVSIIVGVKGPEVYDHVTYSAYDCNGGSHIWNDQTCSGYQMNIGEPWAQYIGDLTSLSRFFSIQMTPYSNNLTESKSFDLQVELMLFNGDQGDGVLLSGENVTLSFDCPSGFGACNTLTVIDQEVLKYDLYMARITLDTDQNQVDYIGDVVFTVWRAHDKFTQYEIAMHVAWVIIASVGIVIYLIYMRHTQMIDWSFEQKFLFLLLIGLLLSDNPFYGLQFIVQGWFFPFLNSIFTVLFLSIFSIYSLSILDRIRLDQSKTQYNALYLSKVAIVIIFSFLAIVLFSWINIHDHRDPIVEPVHQVSPLQCLYYAVIALFIVIMLWIVVIIVMTIPSLSNRRYILPKFILTATPIGLYVISIISGIISGTFGPMNSNALSVSYFITLNNVFTALTAFLYWPVANVSYKAVESRETHKLFGEEDDEEEAFGEPESIN